MRTVTTEFRGIDAGLPDEECYQISLDELYNLCLNNAPATIYQLSNKFGSNFIEDELEYLKIQLGSIE